MSRPCNLNNDTNSCELNIDNISDTVLNSDKVLDRIEYNSDEVLGRINYTSDKLLDKINYNSDKVLGRIDYTDDKVLNKINYDSDKVLNKINYTNNKVLDRVDYDSDEVIEKLDYKNDKLKKVLRNHSNKIGCLSKISLGSLDNLFKNTNDSLLWDDGESCELKQTGCTYNLPSYEITHTDTGEVIESGPNTIDNYDPNAEIDDGSCKLTKRGCTDENAKNYDSVAIIEDGSCKYFEGCIYPNAINFMGKSDKFYLTPEDIYNQTGNLKKYRDDKSCIFSAGGKPTGCTYKDAINFDKQAKIDDGSCKFKELGNDGCVYNISKNYDPSADYDSGGNCNFKLGCTYQGAINYDPNATVDNQSCEFDTSGSGIVIYQIIIIILVLSFAGFYFMKSS
jgi:hypothetical protein